MKFNKLIPELSVSDFKKSVAFYVKILGFQIEYSREKFAFLSLQGSQIMIEQENEHWKTADLHHPYGRGINFQIEVQDVGPILTSIKKNRITLFKPLDDHWYKKGSHLLGCREFLIQDPDGYLLRFSQDIGKKRAPS